MILYLFKIYRAEGLLVLNYLELFSTFYTKSMLPGQLFGIYMV